MLKKTPKDLTGKVFGRLTVVKLHNGPERRWLCACSCGHGTKIATTSNLTGGGVRSCGCLARENRQRLAAINFPDVASSRLAGLRNTDHPLYSRWRAMISRCLNPTFTDYYRYGGRGIKVCERWLTSLANFAVDMGPLPSPDAQIDRTDNNGHYEPGNCRWATRSEQARNRRTSRRLDVNGETATVAEWAERYGITQSLIHSRLNRGWSPADAVTQPRS